MKVLAWGRCQEHIFQLAQTQALANRSFSKQVASEQVQGLPKQSPPELTPYEALLSSQCPHMSYSLNSLKVGYIEDYIGK